MWTLPFLFLTRQGRRDTEMTMHYLDVTLNDLQRTFELARSKPRHLVPQPRVRPVAKADELQDEMGKWLGQLAPWDVFSTWTFSRITQVAGAMFWARRHLRWLQEKAAQPIYAFVGVEKGSSGGLVHVHALVGNVGHLKAYCGEKLPPGQWGRTCCMLHAWPCGMARVLPYDPKLGASHYVSKYVTKLLAEWELVGFPAVPQLSIR